MDTIETITREVYVDGKGVERYKDNDRKVRTVTSKHRSRELTIAVQFANAIAKIESALSEIKEIPAELERLDALQRELKRFIKP